MIHRGSCEEHQDHSRQSFKSLPSCVLIQSVYDTALPDVSLTHSIAIAGMKKRTPSWGVCLLGALFLLSAVCAGLRPNPDAMTAASDGRENRRKAQDDLISKETGGDGILKGLYATGSSLPDCSHACGPCFPCKRVMVIFKCSLAESCPVGYRCTCDGKYYHVPSN